MASWDELMPPGNEDPFSGVSQPSHHTSSIARPSFSRTVDRPPYIPSLQDITENIDITDSQLISRSKFIKSSRGLPVGLTKPLQSGSFSQSQQPYLNPLTPLDINQSQSAYLSSSTESLDFDFGEAALPSQRHDDTRTMPDVEVPKSSQHRMSSYTPRIISQTPTPLTFKRKASENYSEANSEMVLRQVVELPEKYRHIFSFPYFNAVQSAVMDDALFSDKSLVVSAPTGSGKTAVFELAIIRLISFGNLSSFKIVYMAPIKALCTERCNDWQAKFGPLDIKCSELTGDTEDEECNQLQNASIILTTPEKWDSMSRKWRDNKSLVKLVKLFLIDEVHSVNDDTRGPTVEAVISRMKTVKATTCSSSGQDPKLRFVAVSATIPNIEDLSRWIGDSKSPAIYHKFDEGYRPVPLRKVVHGFWCSDKCSPYKFDLTLNYQLWKMISQYANQKPTLVFCSTRKGVQLAANELAKNSHHWNSTPLNTLRSESTVFKEAKLRDLVSKGVGYHHAGMDRDDRLNIQNLFLQGKLPVLMATSTLAFGVNLPAYLVIIKSTQYYVSGQYTEYSETQVIQMMGRAGRPQFDTSATVVIMTRNQTKAKYENLTAGKKNLESSLHNHLIEYLNAEIVLHTINDTSIAVEWLKSTLLYVRILKNPTHYGIRASASEDDIEKHLMDICVSDLNRLSSIGAISMGEEGFDIKSTDIGQLMARYCIAYDTMKKFCSVNVDIDLEEMVNLLSSCHEFADIKLRMNERRLLNTLNKDPNHITIRFPHTGKIKTTQLKVNCLIQATLGCLPIQEFSLQQDVMKIFRVGARVSRCLYEFLQLRGNYKSLLNAAFMAKCFKARLWENSRYVSRQIERIGSSLSTALVNAGIGRFSKLLETNPRQLELIVNRHPPFGNQIHDAVAHLPKYKVEVLQSSKHGSSSAEIKVTVCLENREQLLQKQTTNGFHCSLLLIGNADDEIILKKKIMDTTLLNSIVWSRTLTLQRAKNGDDITVNYISQEYVGLDIQLNLTIRYTDTRYTTNSQQGYRSQPKLQAFMKSVKPGKGIGGKSSSPESSDDIEWSPSAMQGSTQDGRKACNHKCVNKRACGHLCCKNGVAVRQPSKSRPEKRQLVMSGTTPKNQKTMDAFLSQLHTRANCMPMAPQIKRTRVDTGNHEGAQPSLKKFTFKRKPQIPSVHSTQLSDLQTGADTPTPNIPTTQLNKTMTPSSSISVTPKPRGIPNAGLTTTGLAQRGVASHGTGLPQAGVALYGRGLAQTGGSGLALTSSTGGAVLAQAGGKEQVQPGGTKARGLAQRVGTELVQQCVTRGTGLVQPGGTGIVQPGGPGLPDTGGTGLVQTKAKGLAQTGVVSHGTGSYNTPARRYSSASDCPATPARGWEHLDVYQRNRSKLPEPPTCKSDVEDLFHDLPDDEGISNPVTFQRTYNPPKAQRRLILDVKENNQILTPSDNMLPTGSFLPTAQEQLLQSGSIFRLTNPKDSWSFSRQKQNTGEIKTAAHDDIQVIEQPSDIFNLSYSDEDFYASEGSCDMADDPVAERELSGVHNIQLPIAAVGCDTRTRGHVGVPEQLPIVLSSSSSDEDVYHFEGSSASAVAENELPFEQKMESSTFHHHIDENFSLDVGAGDTSQLSPDFDFHQQQKSQIKIGDDVNSVKQPPVHQVPQMSFFTESNSMNCRTISDVGNEFNSIFDDIF